MPIRHGISYIPPQNKPAAGLVLIDIIHLLHSLKFLHYLVNLAVSAVGKGFHENLLLLSPTLDHHNFMCYNTTWDLGEFCEILITQIQIIPFH